MSRILALISMILFMSCTSAQEGLIRNKKWRTVKQVTNTKDAKGTTTSEKQKDFNIMDYLDFDTDRELTIKSYGANTKYSYSIKDSVLTFWSKTEEHKKNDYRIVSSTKDNLVLKRTEIWGNDGALTITVVLYLTKAK